jgi:hypothetical protein
MEIYDQQDRLAGRSLVEAPDFEPALEAARLRVLRQGGTVEEAYAGSTQFSVEPAWNQAPYLDGFVVRALPASGAVVEHRINRSYFRSNAKAAAAKLVDDGKLAEGQAYVWLAAAYHRPANDIPPGAPRRFTLKAAAPKLEISEGRIADFAAGSDRAVDAAEEFPVFVRGSVVEQIVEQGREATDRELETGSLLLGKLYRDEQRLFLEVTAQLPVQAEQGPTRLGFSDSTWAQARAALALRRQQAEFVVGFFHNHPVRTAFSCKNCPIERQRVCPLATPFFSADDVGVMRTAFQRAMQIGLLVTDVSWRDPMVDAFGWNADGLLVRRDFHVLGPCRVDFRASEPEPDAPKGEACENEASDESLKGESSNLEKALPLSTARSS